MLKKIFKTILVLSLCVGLTLPTNAAVSVSDGSAFVTKAEFAADLNNLWYMEWCKANFSTR